MAVYIKNLFRASKDQDFVKARIQQRFLTNTNTLYWPAKRTENFKNIKSAFNERNDCLKLSRSGYNYNSIMEFHHLAMNIFNYVGCMTNIEIRNYAKGRENPPKDFDTHLSRSQDVSVKEKMFQEISRLRRKGAFKELPVKIPEGIVTEKKEK